MRRSSPSMPHPRVMPLSTLGSRTNSSSIRTAACHDNDVLAAKRAGHLVLADHLAGVLDERDQNLQLPAAGGRSAHLPGATMWRPPAGSKTGSTMPKGPPGS